MSDRDPILDSIFTPASAFSALVQQQIGALQPVLERAGYRRASRRQAPRWTAEEDAKLRSLYAERGRAACVAAFKGKRSAGAVQNRCNKLRLVGAPHTSLGRLEWRLACAKEKVALLEAQIAARKARGRR